MSNVLRSALSRSSVFFSSVCLIHCLATPFVILALPSLSVFFSDTLEWILILSVVPLSLAAFVPTWWQHKNVRLAVVFVIGLTFVMLSQFLFHQHSHTSVSVQIPGMASMAVGASMLAWSIYKNNRHTHVCTVPGHKH
jgi:endonuclease/exonuclease/phosphatase (EEP) superfamily protein YafD